MKRVMFLGVVVLLGAVASRPAAAAFTCGGTPVTTTNPTVSTRYVWNNGGATSWHGNVSINAQLVSNTKGFLYVRIDKPDEISDPSNWPMIGTARVNGSNILINIPYGTNGIFYYFEGTQTFTGPYNGGTVAVSQVIYGPDGTGNLHARLGTFNFTGTTSNVYEQFLSGIPAPCPSSSPPQLASSFSYNIDVPPSTWRSGTVSNFQPSGSPYLQLTLSSPYTIGAWIGKAACIIRSPDNFLECYVQTGDSSNIGDPIWTVKMLTSPFYYYVYGQNWYDDTSGGYPIDFWGF